MNFKTFILGLVLCLNAAAQDYILNGDFEKIEDCPKSFTQWRSSKQILPHWNYPTLGTPDYFNRCAEGTPVHVPENFAGKMEPHSGDAYVGFILRGTKKDYREYLQTELRDSLEKGREYCISFYLAYADNSLYVTNRIGIYFSPYLINSGRDDHLKVEPDIVFGKEYFHPEGWVLLKSFYKAKGGERYLVIGNFQSDDEQKITTVKVEDVLLKKYSYYYIDDISLTTLDSCNKCEEVELQAEIVRIMNRQTGASILKAEAFGGKPPYKFAWSNGYKAKEMPEPSPGLYSVEVTDSLRCSGFDSIEISSSVFERVELNKPKILQNIYFEFDKSTFLPESIRQLHDLRNFIYVNDIRQISIWGHTDFMGSDEYNQKLSEERAKAVVDWLIIHGVSPEILRYKGFGKSQPAATSKTDESRALNRRVEFVVYEAQD